MAAKTKKGTATVVKRGKATAKQEITTNDGGSPTPPDRKTWPGWLEIESDPAFFNVMLKDLRIHGLKVVDVYSLEDAELAMLAKPVHALIFLFRYRETDQNTLEKTCPKNVWYAEQVPEYACGTVALMNIVNNIPGLQMGKELSGFKDCTQSLSPYRRGKAIDAHDYIREIHNSFAPDSELLEADLATQEKHAAKLKRQATAKAQATKAAKAKAAREARDAPIKKAPTKTPEPTRASGRHTRSSSKVKESTPPQTSPERKTAPTDEESPSKKAKNATPERTRRSGRLTRSASKATENAAISASPKRKTAPTDEESPSKKSRDVNGAAKPTAACRSTTKQSNGTIADSDDDLSSLSWMSPPPKPKANEGRKLRLKPTNTKPTPASDDEYNDDARETTEVAPRRSGRKPKPIQNPKVTAKAEAEEVEEEKEGFHFCAYLPIGTHVYKLDGLDKMPQNLGAIPTEPGADWLAVAQPELQGRMAQYEASEIAFNIMGVVHDPLLPAMDELSANIKALQRVEKKLSAIVEDWREMEGFDDCPAETVSASDGDLGITALDVDRAEVDERTTQRIDDAGDDLLLLLETRKEIAGQQKGLRVAVQSELHGHEKDKKEAEMRRYDWERFIGAWVGELAEAEVLEDLLES